MGYPGATPETMANNVATPLERQFMQIPGLELVTSVRARAVTNFTLQFDLNKSIDAAATDVQTAITQASGQLPADFPARRRSARRNPNDQPIKYIALSSDSSRAGQLYDYANTQAGAAHEHCAGRIRVLVYGTQAAVRIKADPSQVARAHLTMDDLATAIKKGTSYQVPASSTAEPDTFLLQPQGQLENGRGIRQL